jgi:hypothetical protein
MNKNYQIIFLTGLILVSLISFSESKNKKTKEKKKTRRLSQNETYVIKLNETNFQAFNESNPQYFILFYAPWKSKSNDFEPVFDEASVKAKSLGWNVSFAKVNAGKNKKMAKSWDADSFPVIFWIDNSESEVIEVDQPYSVNVLMRFINTSLNIETEELPDFKTLENKQKNGRSIVFVGDKEKHIHEYKRLVKIARDDSFNQIFDSKSAEFFEKYGINPNSYDAVIYKTKNKTLNEGERLYLKTGDEMTKDYIENIFNIYLRLPWGKLTSSALHSAVESPTVTPTVFVIYDQNATSNLQISHSLENLAIKYRKDFWFLNSTYDSKHAYLIAEVFNITQEKLPYYVLINDNPANSDDVDKYVLSSGNALTQEELETLLIKYRDGKLTKFIYTESTPDKNVDEHGIQKLVGSNFEHKVFQEELSRYLLLFLCVDSNKRCKQGKEIFVRVVNKLSLNEFLNFAEINTAYNEISHLKYDKLPSYVLFSKSDDSESRRKGAKIYSGPINTKSIVEWIRKSIDVDVKEKLLESEVLLNEQELRRPLKSAPKNNEEFYANLEDGHTIGLKRSVSIDFDTTSSFKSTHQNLDDLVDKKSNKPPKKKSNKNESKKSDL